ncbi:hypothetical protein T484DRAFT_1891598 [Baffinella frigidus]|nr:hypothetical protein T484DRAFT_1891598 [Cryptophyta sp. CCMP2293]
MGSREGGRSGRGASRGCWWLRPGIVLLAVLPLASSPAAPVPGGGESVPFAGKDCWWGGRFGPGARAIRIPEGSPTVEMALRIKGDATRPIVFSPGLHMLGDDTLLMWDVKADFVGEHAPPRGDETVEKDPDAPPPGIREGGATGVAEGACLAPAACGAPFPAGDARRAEVWGNWSLQQGSEGVFGGLAMAVHSAQCEEAVLSILGGPWRFEQSDVRSIGGIGLDLWHEAEIEMSRCAVGGLDSHFQRCDEGVRGKMTSRCVLENTILEFCGACEGYGMRLTEQAEGTVRGCTIRENAIGICLEADSSLVLANSTLYRNRWAPLYCAVIKSQFM